MQRPPGASLGSGFWCREPFIQDNGESCKGRESSTLPDQFLRFPFPGEGRDYETGAAERERGPSGAAYSTVTGLRWGSDVCCPRPRRPDLEGSRPSSIAIAGRGWGTCQGPVVGDAGLAEPGTLGCEWVKKAGRRQAGFDSSAQGYLHLPLPPAPSPRLRGSAHGAQIRGGAGLVLPSCGPRPPHAGQRASCQGCRGWHLPL